jgi:hypothetical protein
VHPYVSYKFTVHILEDVYSLGWAINCLNMLFDGALKSISTVFKRYEIQLKFSDLISVEGEGFRKPNSLFRPTPMCTLRLQIQIIRSYNHFNPDLV